MWTDPDYHEEDSPSYSTSFYGWVFLISAAVILGFILWGMYEGVTAVI